MTSTHHHRRSARPIRTTLVVLITTAASLAAGAVALAARPKANGQYAGRTSARKIGGFPAPAGFTVSANGRHVLQFNYSTFACFQTYPRGTDPYSTPTDVVIESMPVTAAGHFSITRSADRIIYGSTGHPALTTTTRLSGRFTSPTSATGTITFSRTFGPQHRKDPVCGSGTVTFTAKLKSVL
jgi:hypothetical protein